MASSLVFLLLCLAGYTVAQNCNPIARCGEKMKMVPECEKEKKDPADECLSAVARDCHNDKDAAKELMRIRLQNTVLCNNKDLRKDFKDKERCYDQLTSEKSMKDCILPLSDARTDIKDINEADKLIKCKNMTEKYEGCKEMPGVFDECRELFAKLLVKSWQELKCGSTAVAVQISLLLACLSITILKYFD